ncbi:conserved hypothetical protein [Ricinus communis]|uniref:Uncharacterized protein n=1 Tax=Ricinus communis TaxID=3988 RepID=B9RHL4_RICCO|nr:conserved hypothetical protein [Ricinus communis]
MQSNPIRASTRMSGARVTRPVSRGSKLTILKSPKSSSHTNRKFTVKQKFQILCQVNMVGLVNFDCLINERRSSPDSS